MDFAFPNNLCYKKLFNSQERRGNWLSKDIWTHHFSEGRCTQTGLHELRDEFT